ncbi:MAG: Coproporphyrinogen III oxidase, aerobic, partial [uncultured Sphingomonadaceae bacterium]
EARRGAGGGAELVRGAARPNLRRVRGDRARGGVGGRVRVYRVGPGRSRRRAGRRRGAWGDEGRGVREGRRQRVHGRRRVRAGFRGEHPRRGGRSALLRHRDQPRRAHGEPARARGAHEHALPVHHQALVRRRRGPEPADPVRGGHGDVPRGHGGGVRREPVRGLSAVQEVGGRLFLHPASRRPPRGRRHLLRPCRRRFPRGAEARAVDGGSVPGRVRPDRAATDGAALDRGGQGAAARMARALRGVQPAVRPGNAVRVEDGRQCRRHPDEPAAGGDVGL